MHIGALEAFFFNNNFYIILITEHILLYKYNKHK